MANSFSDVTELQNSIFKRWGIVEWERHFPWWRHPAKVRILMYADDSVHFNGGGFRGLQYVYNLLKSRAYFYVDFHIKFAHRNGTDPTATIPGANNLTDLDIMNKFDEIWFFGLNSTPNLTNAEVALMTTFMAAPKMGGVLVTGDHASLGRGIAGQLPRAGRMRLYPAPDAGDSDQNSTLHDGPDPGSTVNFDDQSDDEPQSIRYRRYWLPSKFATIGFRPHPLLCGPDGPIDFLPDHQHEGEAIAPSPAAGDPEWPTKATHQERPEVIAWGKINDPTSAKYLHEIGVISAYDGHNVDVGRIVADSTWHHWFDINITGVAAPPSPYAGFDATPAGLAALKKIDAYFLNTGVWLAPPDRQAEMRNAAWWSILWSDQVIELQATASIRTLGETAIDALGRRASRCSVYRWIVDWPIFKEKIPHGEWPVVIDRLKLIDVPFETFVAGGILRQLITDVGPSPSRRVFPPKPVDDGVLEKSMAIGVALGIEELGRELNKETAFVARLVDAKFDLSSLTRAKGNISQ